MDIMKIGKLVSFFSLIFDTISITFVDKINPIYVNVIFLNSLVVYYAGLEFQL